MPLYITETRKNKDETYVGFKNRYLVIIKILTNSYKRCFQGTTIFHIPAVSLEITKVKIKVWHRN